MQQAPVLSPQLAAEEKVASQPTIEILHDGAGSNRRLAQFVDGLADFPEPTSQSSTQGRFLGPAPAIAIVATEYLENTPKQLGSTPKLVPQAIETLIELLRKSEELVPSVFQRPTARLESARAQRNPSPEFGHHEVIQFAALGVATTSHAQDIVTQPIQQQPHVLFHEQRGLAGCVDIMGDEMGPIYVTRLPMGTAEGRLVDEKGLPRANVEIQAMYLRNQGVDRHVDRLDAGARTGPDGRFQTKHLVPGLFYSFEVLEQHEKNEPLRSQGYL